jgi:hypothetical protein
MKADGVRVFRCRSRSPFAGGEHVSVVK